MSYVARRAPKAFATAGPVGEMIKSTEAEWGARGCKEEKGRGEERRRGGEGSRGSGREGERRRGEKLEERGRAHPEGNVVAIVRNGEGAGTRQQKQSSQRKAVVEEGMGQSREYQQGGRRVVHASV